MLLSLSENTKMRDTADLVLEDVEYKQALKIVIGLLCHGRGLEKEGRNGFN